MSGNWPRLEVLVRFERLLERRGHGEPFANFVGVSGVHVHGGPGGATSFGSLVPVTEKLSLSGRIGADPTTGRVHQQITFRPLQPERADL